MLERKLTESLKNNPFVLAPMAGITDCAFRSFMREMGASIVITELVSASGLKYSSERTKKLMRFEDVQRPVGVQIFGEDLDAMAYAAKEVEQMGADFVDINFGCPVPKVVKRGAGSAALKDLVFFRNVLCSVKRAVQIPVTIKVRTGWDQQTRNTHEVAQIAYDEGITWLAIHGRTRAQAYSGEADWEYIKNVKENAKLPVIGNGDLTSAWLANKRLNDSLCDGVMIGRGCLKNPWIFQEALQMQAKAKTNSDTEFKKEFSKIFDSLVVHLQRTSESRIVALQTKKIAAWYSAGYPGSSAFRKKIFNETDQGQVLSLIKDYFYNIDPYHQKDTSSEPFLMGGHG